MYSFTAHLNRAQYARDIAEIFYTYKLLCMHCVSLGHGNMETHENKNQNLSKNCRRGPLNGYSHKNTALILSPKQNLV